MDLTDGAGNGRVRKPRIRVTKALRNLSQASVTQGLLVFRNSDQFERLMHLDGVVSECGGDILPTVQSQQIQDGIANAG